MRGPRLWVKRDDATGLAGGGNKVRKLEYLLAEAMEQGADVVLTPGALQSNHARQTAAACARLGLACELFLDDPLPDAEPSYAVSGNVLLDRVLGATVHEVPTPEDFALSNAGLEARMAERAAELRSEGRRPYTIPLGGSTGLGALGYVHAAHELAAQCSERAIRPDAVVLATSSGATHVGLATGLRQLGWPTRVIGVCVAGDEALIRRRSAVVAAELTALGVDAVRADDLEIDADHLGPGYGRPAPATADAIRLAGATEALLLDPVYTGKAMAGLLARVRDGDLRGARDVVFLHTGGWTALFAYGGWLGAELGPPVAQPANP